MKILKAIVLILIMLSLFACVSFGKNSELDNTRVFFINEMASYINDYFDIKGYYPFASGEYNLSVCIYFSSNLEEVDYPFHFNNMTVYDYSVFIEELRSVLGQDLVIENDPIETHKKGSAYIARYYSAGNSYLITANLFNGNNFTTHNRFDPPNGAKITNKSKIKEFLFYPGFMHRYSIANISDVDNFTFSLEDYNRIVKSNYKIEELDDNLMYAIENSDYEEVRKLLTSGVPINPIHRNFNLVNSPLIFAVKNDDFKMVKLLIDNGSDVDARGSYEDVVLIYALSKQNINTEIVKLLLENGANVNIPNFFAFSPFIGVCQTGDVELAKLFIQYGADLNQDYYYYYPEEGYMLGNTPIKAAISNSNYEIVELLIENNCEFRKSSIGDSQTPLEYAVEIGDDKMITLLKKYLD